MPGSIILAMVYLVRSIDAVFADDLDDLIRLKEVPFPQDLVCGKHAVANQFADRVLGHADDLRKFFGGNENAWHGDMLGHRKKPPKYYHL